MAYRRSHQAGIFGSRWRIKHQSELADCGIPTEVAADDRRWAYVLLHGDDSETGWCASWLTDEQTTKLLALLEQQSPNPVATWLAEARQRVRGARETL